MPAPVTAPDGRTWRVRRRWLPRLGSETVWGRFHRRFRQTIERSGDVGDPGCAIDVGEGIVVVIGLVLVVLFLAFVGLPLLVAVLDLVVLLVLAVAGVVARVVFRRPWTVEATAGDGESHRWQVVGWRASGARRAEVEQLLAAGVQPPPDLG